MGEGGAGQRRRAFYIGGYNSTWFPFACYFLMYLFPYHL